MNSRFKRIEGFLKIRCVECGIDIMECESVIVESEDPSLVFCSSRECVIKYVFREGKIIAGNRMSLEEFLKDR